MAQRKKRILLTAQEQSTSATTQNTAVVRMNHAKFKMQYRKTEFDLARDFQNIWHPCTQHKDFETIKLILAKQRNGPTGNLQLAFRRQFTRFTSMHGGSRIN